jgi:hypothetical protein
VDRTSATLATVRHDLMIALGLEVFALFGFVVAILGSLGAFAGGSTPQTPVLAQAYFVVGFVVTVPVIARTKQMLDAVGRKDIAAVKRLDSRALVWVALIFSAMLPAIYLSTAAAEIRNLE